MDVAVLFMGDETGAPPSQSPLIQTRTEGRGAGKEEAGDEAGRAGQQLPLPSPHAGLKNDNTLRFRISRFHVFFTVYFDA